MLTLGFDDDGHLWNLPRMGAFVFHNTSCLLLLLQSGSRPFKIAVFFKGFGYICIHWIQWNFSKLDPQKTGPPWISAKFLSPCLTILCKRSLTKLAISLNRPYFLVPVLDGFEKFHCKLQISTSNPIQGWTRPVEPKLASCYQLVKLLNYKYLAR
jgi:hypothetical protein